MATDFPGRMKYGRQKIHAAIYVRRGFLFENRYENTEKIF